MKINGCCSKNYINNISNTNSLREYINEQLPVIRKKIATLGKSVDDKVVKIKLKEVISQLNKVKEGRVVKDSQRFCCVNVIRKTIAY